MDIFFADPPIKKYKKIYREFQKISGYKVDLYYVIEYFWNTYRIPYGYIYEMLTKYRTTTKNDITEEEFLEFMMRWYNIKIKNLHNCVAIFNKIDRNHKNYITYHSLLKEFININVSEEFINKIKSVLKELGFYPFNTLDFFDFLMLMSKIDLEGLITI